VVIVHRRDYAEFRLDDVGCVQAAAQANFKHGDIDALLAKDHPRHRGHGLEVARMQVDFSRFDQPFRYVMNGAESLCEFIRRDRFAIDPDPLGRLE
jgi:hypothetical protein